jgi:acetoin utilization protein AcuB
MIIDDIMSRKVVTVEMDDRLHTVKEIFDRLHFHHLPVLADGIVFGVVSDRDLLKAISPRIGTAAESERDAATLNKRVHQIMSRKPITLQRGAHVSEAVEVFNTHRISCIPIVDASGRPVGLLSWRDLLKALAQKFKEL